MLTHANTLKEEGVGDLDPGIEQPQVDIKVDGVEVVDKDSQDEGSRPESH